MRRPDLSRVPEWYHGYIKAVKVDDFREAMQQQTLELPAFLANIPESKRKYRYAPGKWTVQEVVQHISDAERIFGYRALCFARKDETPLPAFDENEYAKHSNADSRDWTQMQSEFMSLRAANELMFASFDDAQLACIGTANQSQMSVLDLGFIIVGHVTHHLNIIANRYLQ